MPSCLCPHSMQSLLCTWNLDRRSLDSNRADTTIDVNVSLHICNVRLSSVRTYDRMGLSRVDNVWVELIQMRSYWSLTLRLQHFEVGNIHKGMIISLINFVLTQQFYLLLLELPDVCGLPSWAPSNGGRWDVQWRGARVEHYCRGRPSVGLIWFLWPWTQGTCSEGKVIMVSLILDTRNMWQS